MPKTPDFRFSRDPNDLLNQVRKPKMEPETGWWKVVPSGSTPPYPPDQQREVFFENAWDHADSTTWPVSWYQSHHGEVRLRGKATGDVAGTVIFTLPEDDRPENEETFIVSVDDSGNIDLSGIKFRAWGAGDA